MFWRIVAVYAVVSAVLIATSTLTTIRATRISGDPHYLLTQTSIYVSEPTPPANPTDAALDEAFAEDDDPDEAADAGRMLVERPIFILGFADATGPFIILGGAALFAAGLIRRRQRRGLPPAPHDSAPPSSSRPPTM